MPKTHTVYDAMAFPPYVHREYPKHVHPDGPCGRVVVLNDADEELAFLLEQERAAAKAPGVKEARR